MTTKLTLSIDGKTVALAKKYAKRNQRSLSSLVENYLKSISKEEKEEDSLSPSVRSLLGALKVPEDFDYKKELTNALAHKYSL